MSIPPMSMPAARRSTYHHAAATRNAMDAEMMSVSRFRSADDATLRHVEIGEAAPGVREIERDRGGRLRPAAADLGDRVLEPVGHVDTHAVLSAGDGVQDRLAAPLGDAGDGHARAPRVDVHLEVDLREDRIVDFLERAGEDVEDGGAGLGVLP